MTTPLAPHPPLNDFYGEPSRRETFVRNIFDDTAPWYDRAIAFMSFGSGDWYRRDALKRAGLEPGMKLLDVATGTGVVARAAEAVTGHRNDIVGLDPSIGMISAGLGKARFRNVQAMSEQIPFASSSFDMITIGFAMRHFADLNVVFNEARRVLRPGGRILILEITAPDSRLGRAFLGAYMGGIVPALLAVTSLNSGPAKLMRYYWATTRDCVRPHVIMDALSASGFTDVARHVELGMFSEYSGVR